jgi:hypothetical protein
MAILVNPVLKVVATLVCWVTVQRSHVYAASGGLQRNGQARAGMGSGRRRGAPGCGRAMDEDARRAAPRSGDDSGPAYRLADRKAAALGAHAGSSCDADGTSLAGPSSAQAQVERFDRVAQQLRDADRPRTVSDALDAMCECCRSLRGSAEHRRNHQRGGSSAAPIHAAETPIGDAIRTALERNAQERLIAAAVDDAIRAPPRVPPIRINGAKRTAVVASV